MKSKFLKLSTWKMILNSRLIAYKNSKEPWCKERREICKNCEYNSKNKSDLSFKEKLFMSLQITKSICTACFCSVARKTLIKQSSCGLEEIDLTPKWREKEN